MANAAGVSERTFFRYFRTREDIMSAFPDRGNRALAARVVARPASEGVLEAFMGALRDAQGAPANGQDPPIDEDWPIDQDWLFLWGRARQNWPLDSPAPYMIVTYAEAIAERLGVPVGDPEVGIMATVISNVIWAGFRRWLQGGGVETLNVVVEDSFAALHRLIEDVGKPAEETPRRRRS
jgi:AcrR family transcriptional regulator